MSEFCLTPKIYTETDVEKLYQTYLNQRILLICDSFLVENPVLLHLLHCLAEGKNQIEIFKDVIPDPPLENVAAAVRQIVNFQPDILIAIGGGSALDTAKASRFFANQTSQINIKEFIAIPSTSGSGSEVTSVAVVTDTKKNIKYPLIHDYLLPTKVILLPELVLTCPAYITACSGMDVLTHALEALVAKGANGLTDCIAERAIELVFKELPRCYADGQSIEARKKMQEASCLAGIAFQNAGLGVVHAVSHQIGGNFHLTHGMINALLIPGAIQLNAKNIFAKSKYTQLARRLNFISDCDNEDMAISNLINQICQLRKELNLPSSLSECQVNSSSVATVLQELVCHAEEDFTIFGNPIPPSRDDLVKLILGIL